VVVPITPHADGAALEAIAPASEVRSIVPAASALRPPHLSRITTTISVLLSRPQRRMAIATD
jgi:hypothetical protein